jgi:hypothetical protein
VYVGFGLTGRRGKRGEADVRSWPIRTVEREVLSKTAIFIRFDQRFMSNRLYNCPTLTKIEFNQQRGPPT